MAKAARSMWVKADGKWKKISDSFPASDIKVEGWNGIGLSMSAGVTPTTNQYGKAYVFSPDAVNWLRIPSTATPNLLNENTVIKQRVMLTTPFAGDRCTLLARYYQGKDEASWLLAVKANGDVMFAYNNVFFPTTGKMRWNALHEIVIISSQGKIRVSMDNVTIYEMDDPGTFTVNWDYTVGSYFNKVGEMLVVEPPDTPETPRHVWPCGWILFALEIKRI